MVHGSWLKAQLSSGPHWIHTYISGGWIAQFSVAQINLVYIHDLGSRCVQSFKTFQLIIAVTRPTHLGNSMHKQDPMTKWSWAWVWTWSSGQPIRPSTYIYTYVLSSFENNGHWHGPGHGHGHGNWLEVIWCDIGPASGWLKPVWSWLGPIWGWPELIWLICDWIGAEVTPYIHTYIHT